MQVLAELRASVARDLGSTGGDIGPLGALVQWLAETEVLASQWGVKLAAFPGSRARPEDVAALVPEPFREFVHRFSFFLASDLTEGRLVGTPGYALAAEFIKSRFERLGLSPAGPTAPSSRTSTWWLRRSAQTTVSRSSMPIRRR